MGWACQFGRNSPPPPERGLSQSAAARETHALRVEDNSRSDPRSAPAVVVSNCALYEGISRYGQTFGLLSDDDVFFELVQHSLPASDSEC
jgi:hypothetical protein